jgi:plasmid segregation protein ParM
MLIVGADGGSFATKIATSYGVFQYRSCLGEYREFNLDKELGPNELIFEFNGKKGFAGTLAENESLFIREMAGDTKAHEDALIRILIGLHQFTNEVEFQLIVGQPIKKHKAEKAKIMEMLKGKRTITVNGVTKTFKIQDVFVAPEGAGAFFSYNGQEETVRIIDCGGGTVNMATIRNGTFIDRDSWTLNYGANSQEHYETEKLVEAIIASSSKRWSKNDCVRICGGISEMICPLLSHYFSNIQVIRPLVGGKFQHPVFANAVGFYRLGVEAYG